MSLRWLALALLLAPSCTTVVPIEGQDENVLFSDLRFSWPLRGQPQGGAEARPASTFRTAMDVGGTYGRGTSEQAVLAGQTVELESIIFSGPTVLDADYGLAFGGINLRAGWHFDDGSSLEALFGLGFSSLELEISDGAQTDDDSIFEIGPLFGFTGGHDFGPAGIRATGKVQFGFPDEGTGVTVLVFDLGGVLHAGPSTTFGLGWRWIQYEAEHNTNSDIDLELSGPVISFTLSP